MKITCDHVSADRLLLELPRVDIWRSGTDGTLAAMSCWQYAQLTITVDGRASRDDARTIVWHGPGQGVGENYSDSGQPVLELLNRFGADGWELAGLQDYRDGGNGTSYWEAACC